MMVAIECGLKSHEDDYNDVDADNIWLVANHLMELLKGDGVLTC